MKDTRAITICVDYHDTLALTLPYNIAQFESMCVVTTPDDRKTIDIATEHGAKVLCTDIFYRDEAVFNKFAALEAGLDYFGRDGWICILDADIVIPKVMHPWQKRIGNLYTPRRRILVPVPQEIPEERKWRQYRYPRATRNEPFCGYCQIFHGSDPVLGIPPWHQMNWTWAAGGDTYFERRWHQVNKVRPPFEVLHLGEPFKNWAGRVTPFTDGTVHPEAARRRGILQNLLNQRKRHLFKDKYEAEKIR